MLASEHSCLSGTKLHAVLLLLAYNQCRLSLIPPDMVIQIGCSAPRTQFSSTSMPFWSDMTNLLMQKSEGAYGLIGASAGLADCLTSIFWRGDLSAALCAIAVRVLGMDLRMPDSEVKTDSFFVACQFYNQLS